MSAAFYTGSYGHCGEEGILRLHADFSTGTISKMMGCPLAECPSYLFMHPNGRILYAVRELTEEGAFFTFSVSDHSLTLLSTLPTLGKDPCYISLDESLQFLIIVNYSGSTFCVYQLDDNGLPVSLTDHICHIGSGPDSIRQEAAHPHCAICRNGKVYVCDLGMDRVFCYQLDRNTGKLTESHRINAPSGSGPRHLLFPDADPSLMYVAAELSSEVLVYRLEEKGALLLQRISTLPTYFREKSTVAALKLNDDGTTLFVSNRGDDSIAAFRIQPDGLLELKCICKTGGKTPRDFSVFGNHLVVANQESNLITVLEFNPDAYSLTLTPTSFPALRPTLIMDV